MEDPKQYSRCGWQSNLDAFIHTEARGVRLRLQEFIEDASTEQIRAWDQSIPWLQRECRALEVRDVAAKEYHTILEYELPRDFRRPDVVILENGCVAVLELKGALKPSQAAIDQALGYARDLSAYHSACAGRPVYPVLITRGSDSIPIKIDGVYIVGPEGLNLLLDEFSEKDGDVVPINRFLAHDAYAPLPSIVRAAREVFNKRPLPMIKRARAATEPALEFITEIAHRAAREKKRNLVLLSGVPGSGKTLVGLQLVHSGWVDDLAVEREGGKPTAPAVYLSGNGPLVEVLQHALREDGGSGNTFVQAIKKYVAFYSRRGAAMPPEHLIVFDEAQRAHDAERVAKVHNEPIGKSEPQHLIEFCERIPDWCVLVALIGDGQAIHVGEESGISLWAEAISATNNAHQWQVNGAPAFSNIFESSGVLGRWNDALNLDTEIRFHLTPKVHQFVAGILDGKELASLALLGDELYQEGHRFLVTRDLSVGQSYLRERYEGAAEARYGMLASSKDKWLLSHDVDNSFMTTRRLKVGPWYNSPPSSPESCCKLKTVATEFSSQGLELDCALLAWGSDLLWEGGDWTEEYGGRNRPPLNDPLTVRKNVYRVLLTRGRDGTVIYMPADERMDATYERLISVGMREIQDA
jgi:hypothetical protein